MIDRPDYAREIRYELTDAAAVCEQLGLLAGRGTWLRQAGGVIVRCPWHEDRTPSCSVRRGPDGTIAVKCHGCQQGGDVLSLVAVVRGLNTRSDFPRVLREAAEIAGMWAIVEAIETGKDREDRPEPKPPAPEPERTYPPSDEVWAVWDGAAMVTDNDEVAEYLSGRAIDPEVVAASDLARAVSPAATLPRWASYQRESWARTGHRLIVPMIDVSGSIMSLRSIRVTPGETPKRLPPGGHRATSLVMADEIGQAMLRGTFKPERVVVSEGEPDFLTWASRRRIGPVAAVLGIVTGSWNQDFAAKVPDGAEVIIRTDHDQAGEAYASAIRSTLRHRCFIRRAGRA